MKRFLTLGLFMFALLPLRAEPEYPAQGPDIYDPKSDGNAQIAKALIEAKSAHKHVLLMFGANWCPWCRRLHHTFETEASVAKTLSENYVLVLVDSNWRNGTKRNYDVNVRYGDPLHQGLPVFVVLDQNGKQLTTQETGVLEDGEGHSAVKVNEFLAKWAPKNTSG